MEFLDELDSASSATEASRRGVSKEPIEQLHNGCPKGIGGFPVPHERHYGNEAHEDKAQPYDAEQRINGIL